MAPLNRHHEPLQNRNNSLDFPIFELNLNFFNAENQNLFFFNHLFCRLLDLLSDASSLKLSVTYIYIFIIIFVGQPLQSLDERTLSSVLIISICSSVITPAKVAFIYTECYSVPLSTQAFYKVGCWARHAYICNMY